MADHASGPAGSGERSGGGTPEPEVAPEIHPEADPEADPESWLTDHGNALFAFARRRVGSDAAAEDLVQDTLLSAWRSRDGFRGDASVRTWLIAILRRKVVDHYRRSAREGAMVSLSQFFGPEGGRLEPVRRDAIAPEGPLEAAELRADLAACADGLPPTLAGAFVLREIDGKNAETVCQELGITPSNLWARLHRARLWMRACLERRWARPPGDPPNPP